MKKNQPNQTVGKLWSVTDTRHDTIGLGGLMAALTTDDADQRQIAFEQTVRHTERAAVRARFASIHAAGNISIDEQVRLYEAHLVRLGDAFRALIKTKAGANQPTGRVLRAVPIDSVAFLTLQVMVAAAAGELSVQEAGRLLGRALRAEQRERSTLAQVKKEWKARHGRVGGTSDPAFAQELARRQREQDVLAHYVHTGVEDSVEGTPLIYCAVDVCSEVFVLREHQSDVKQLVFSDKAREDRLVLVERSAGWVDADRQPMLTWPRPWRSIDDGGFITRGLPLVNPRSGKVWQTGYKAALREGRLGRALGALNHLQNTVWTVDRRLA